MPVHVFVSYAGPDRPWAEWVASGVLRTVPLHDGRVGVRRGDAAAARTAADRGGRAAPDPRAARVRGPVRRGRNPSPRTAAPGAGRSAPPRLRAFTGRTAHLAGLRERLSAGERAVVQALHGLGGVARPSWYPDALALDEESLRGCRRTFGADRPYTLACAANLALTRRVLGG